MSTVLAEYRANVTEKAAAWDHLMTATGDTDDALFEAYEGLRQRVMARETLQADQVISEHEAPWSWEALARSYRRRRSLRQTGEALGIADRLTELMIEGRLQ
jgi:hypothetical protein